MSSISSASSSTTIRTSSSGSEPRPMWSTARPGVATTTCDAPVELLQLPVDRLSAVDRHDPHAEVSAVLEDRLADLHRQLAGRHQHQRARAPCCVRSGCRAVAGSGARTQRSCRFRSPPGRAGRCRRAAAGSSPAGSGSVPRNRDRRARRAARAAVRERRNPTFGGRLVAGAGSLEPGSPDSGSAVLSSTVGSMGSMRSQLWSTGTPHPNGEHGLHSLGLVACR